jgi:hypothetical protein
LTHPPSAAAKREVGASHQVSLVQVSADWAELLSG